MHLVYFFFFNDTATTEIYTLSLHNALPIFPPASCYHARAMEGTDQLFPEVTLRLPEWVGEHASGDPVYGTVRSEEHTSELQSRQYLVCRLLLEKKRNTSRVVTRGETADGRQ